MAGEGIKIMTLAARPCDPGPDTINPQAPPETPPCVGPLEAPMQEPPATDPVAPAPEQPGRTALEIPGFDDDGR